VHFVHYAKLITTASLDGLFPSVRTALPMMPGHGMQQKTTWKEREQFLRSFHFNHRFSHLQTALPTDNDQTGLPRLAQEPTAALQFSL